MGQKMRQVTKYFWYLSISTKPASSEAHNAEATTKEIRFFLQHHKTHGGLFTNDRSYTQIYIYIYTVYIYLSIADDDFGDFDECGVVFTTRVGKVVFAVSPGQILVVGCCRSFSMMQYIHDLRGSDGHASWLKSIMTWCEYLTHMFSALLWNTSPKSWLGKPPTNPLPATWMRTSFSSYSRHRIPGKPALSAKGSHSY